MGLIWIALQRLWKLNWHWNKNLQKASWNLWPEPNLPSRTIKKSAFSLGLKKDLQCHNVILKIHTIQSQIIHPTKNQRNLNLRENKWQDDPDVKITKGHKLAVIDMLYPANKWENQDLNSVFALTHHTNYLHYSLLKINHLKNTDSVWKHDAHVWIICP